MEQVEGRLQGVLSLRDFVCDEPFPRGAEREIEAHGEEGLGRVTQPAGDRAGQD